MAKPPAPGHARFTVDWSPLALRDVDEIHAFVASDAPTAALRIRRAIVEVGDSLELFPDRGPVLRGLTRRLVILDRYLLRYRIGGSVVRILRVRDGRRH